MLSSQSIEQAALQRVQERVQQFRDDPLGFVMYVVLWEGFFSGFVSGVRLLSIRHYAIAVMHGLDPRRFAEGDHLGLMAALAVCAVSLGVFALLSVRRLQRMDVP